MISCRQHRDNAQGEGAAPGGGGGHRGSCGFFFADKRPCRPPRSRPSTKGVSIWGAEDCRRFGAGEVASVFVKLQPASPRQARFQRRHDPQAAAGWMDDVVRSSAMALAPAHPQAAEHTAPPRHPTKRHPQVRTSRRPERKIADQRQAALMERTDGDKGRVQPRARR